MSMYNMLFGYNLLSPLLLKILDIKTEEIPRFRDAYWDGQNIVILTRTGGGNRDDYWVENALMGQHFNFIRDEDDDFDCTYAKFYYELPKNFEYIRDWLNDRTSEEPKKKWEDLFQKLDENKTGDPIVQNALAFGKELASKINSSLNK